MKRSSVKQNSGDLLARPPATGVLQRKCACGNDAATRGECKECAKKNEPLQRKARDANELTQVPSSVQEVLSSPGHPLESETRGLMEPRFGRDFSQVRLHTDANAAKSAEAVNALAYTVGRDVVFGAGEYQPRSPEGRQLLAHELTHVDQQGGMSTGHLQAIGGTGALEAEADRNAALINSGSRSLETHAGPGNGLGIQRKDKGKGEVPPTLRFQLIVDTSLILDADEARDCLEAYKKMSAAERHKIFEINHLKGDGITRILSALPAEDAAGPYRNEVRELLRWIEEAETRIASGLTDDKMAELKAADMKTKAEAKAKAAQAAKAAKAGKAVKAAPTAADLAKAHDEEVKETSVAQTVTNRWTALTKKKRTEMLAAGKKAIDDVVDHAKKTHPELKLTKDSFKLDFYGVDERGQGVLAMGGTVGGKPVAVVGFDFVTATQVNPAYALSTVVHEIFGHPEYEKYGSEYHLALYDKSVRKAGFRQKPEGSTERQTEIDAYALQETEIYALMRELPYWTEVTAGDEAKNPGLTKLNYDPRNGIDSAIGNIKTQWHDSKLAIPLLHGLHVRLRNDPRIAAMSLIAFVDALGRHFTEAEVKEITK